MDVPNEIVFNWIKDLQKKDVDKIDRANILKSYLVSQKISQNKLAIELGISKSLMHDWISWANYDKKKYEELKAIGYTETELYTKLRTPLKQKSVILETDIDFALWKLISKVNEYKNNFPKSKKTYDLINETKQIILLLENFYKNE